MATLWDILSGVGYALDTPGALTRGVLSGRPGSRATGREMLERLGLVSANQEGLDAGDVAGFGADLVVDPLNALGLGMVTKAARGAKTAKAFNTKAEKLLKTGGMPEDVAKATKAVDATGKPLTMYHGTPHVYDKPNPLMWDEDALYGPGHYMTANPQVASEYATKGERTIPQPRPEFATAIESHDPRILRAAEASWGSAGDVDFLMGSMTVPKFMQLPTEQKIGELLFAAEIDPRNTGKALEGLVDFIPPQPHVRMSYLDARNPLTLDDASNPWLSAQIQGSPNLAPQRLGKAGYDTMRHTGGQRMGTIEHDVWIATDPAQLYSPWIAPNPKAVPRVLPRAAALGGYNATQAALAALGING